ncbi:5613_t:CDS:2 [Paraglomus occultum]|uniref:5613_t:CDS:1 n=1 Tax=Paraglomus occultum TaxID=144539 RepID=A0A9N9GR27_9GLOM|nr:5613_t:CDS:2 [Paraglomus occultum]
MAFIQKAFSKVFTKSLSGCHAIDQLIDDSKEASSTTQLHWIEESEFIITQTSKNDVLYTTRNVNDNKVTEALLPLGPQEKLTPELCKGCVKDLRVRISTYCCRCHEEKSPNEMSPDLVVKPGKTNSADQQETEFTHLEDISLDEDSRTADQAEANGAEVSNDSKVAGSRSKSDIPDITFTPVASSYDNSSKSTDNVSSDTHSGSQRKSPSASNTDSRSATNSQSIPVSWKSTQKSAPDADGWNSTSIRSALDVGGWSPPNWTIDDTANWTPPDWSTSDTGDGHGPANRSAPNVDNWGAPDSGSRHRPNFGWSSTSRPYERKNNTWTDNVMSEDWGDKRSSNNIPRDDHRKKGEKESSVRIWWKPGHVSKDCPDKVCHNCSKPGHTAKDCPNKTNEVICHNCSKPGHTIKDCPTKICNYCKKPGHLIRECQSRNRNKNGFRPTPEQHSGDFDNDRSRSHQRESDKAQKSRSSSVSSQASYRQFGWQIPIKESSSNEKNVASDKQNNAANKQGSKRRKARPSNANQEGERNDDENNDNKNYKDLMMAFQEIQKGMKNKGTSNACSDSESGNGKDAKSNADEEEEDTGVQPVMESYVRWRNTEAEEVLTLMKVISENQQTEGDGEKSDDENKESKVIKDDDGWIPPEEYEW